MPDFKKGYAGKVHHFAEEMKEACRKSKVDRRELAQRESKVKEWQLKVQLLADDSENVAQIQPQVNVKDEALTASRVAASQSTKALDARSRTHATLQLELDALHATGEHREGILRDFV